MHQHVSGVQVMVVLQVVPDELVDDQILIGHLWLGRPRLIKAFEDLQQGWTRLGAESCSPGTGSLRLCQGWGG